MRNFRGKRIDNGEWVYGWYCKVEGQHFIIPDDATIHGLTKPDSIMGFIEVIPDSVGQQTGLKDKNGVEIYEGDKLIDDVGDIAIVRFGKLPLDKSGDCVCTYQAFYLECLGQLGQAPIYECADIGDWMEVIGNIHSNPELMEQTNE